MSENKFEAALHALLTEQNYTKKGRLFYRRQENIVCCVMTERGHLDYLCAFIVPLYMPHEFLTKTYGKELCLGVAAEDPAKTIADATALLKGEVFPFFDRMCTEADLLTFLSEDMENIQQYFQCPELWIDLLALYTAAKTSQDAAFCLARQKTTKALRKANFLFPARIAQIEEEIRTLERLHDAEEAQRKAFFSACERKSLWRCFGEK